MNYFLLLVKLIILEFWLIVRLGLGFLVGLPSCISAVHCINQKLYDAHLFSIFFVFYFLGYNLLDDFKSL